MMNQILVAEDDEDDYSLLKDIFKKIYPQINLIWVKDGEELTELLFKSSNSKPACIILDLNMPKKDGRQALAEIRAKKDLQDIPIIVFTTSASKADKLYVGEFGRTSFVTKPIGLSKYEDFVRSMVMIHLPELQAYG